MNTDKLLDSTRRARLWLLGTIVVILVGWALHATGAFMVPVTFALFLALVVAPLDRRVAQSVPERVDWLGHVAAMGAILLALLIFVGAIWIAAGQLLERFPLGGAGGDLLPGFGADAGGAAADATGATAGTASQSPGTSGSGGSIVDQLRQAFSDAGGSLIQNLGGWAAGIASQILSAAGATLGAAVLVFFLTLLMLIEGPTWRRKMSATLDPGARDQALESVGIIIDKLRRYLLARTVLGLVTAALYVAWLWIFGIDLLLVWGLLAVLLNYIPTLGSLIAGGLPVIYAFVQKDVGTALAVGAGILVIEQVMGNYVDPRVQGRQLSLSSLVVLITLLVWGWIWGVAGALLAVPITIAAMVICAHVPRLRPFALMLSDETDYEGLDRQLTRSDH